MGSNNPRKRRRGVVCAEPLEAQREDRHEARRHPQGRRQPAEKEPLQAPASTASSTTTTTATELSTRLSMTTISRSKKNEPLPAPVSTVSSAKTKQLPPQRDCQRGCRRRQPTNCRTRKTSAWFLGHSPHERVGIPHHLQKRWVKQAPLEQQLTVRGRVSRGVPPPT